MEELISLREFARRLGVSDTAVRKAIDAGKISRDCLDHSNAKRPKIDADRARTEWGKNYVPHYTQSEKLEASLISQEPTTSKKPKPPAEKLVSKTKVKQLKEAESDAEHPTGVEHNLTDVDSDTINLSRSADTKEAKRVEAIAKAKIAMVELKEKKGKLIDKSAAYKEFFAAGQAVRAAFQGIPDKWIDNILACSTRSEAHAMLTEAIVEALGTLSKPPTLN